MSDNQQQAPVDEQAKQEVVAAIVAAVGNPYTTKAEAGSHLETLYNHFMDEQNTQGAEIVAATYNALVQMDQALGVAVDVAAAVKAGMQSLQEDRDLYVEKWMDLDAAVRLVDADNPLVANLIEYVEDEKEALMRITKFVSDYPGFDMVTNGDLEVDESDAQSFHMMLFGDWKLTTEEKADLSEYITDFVNMVRDREAFEKRQRESAARKQAS